MSPSDTHDSCNKAAIVRTLAPSAPDTYKLPPHLELLMQKNNNNNNNNTVKLKEKGKIEKIKNRKRNPKCNKCENHFGQ